MKKQYILLVVIFLFGLNFLAWGEVFSLSKPRYLKVNFLSVGQGDSQFIETPQGHQILIDGGPNSIVLQKLSENMPQWDKNIDLVILTHPESDHMRGLIEVFQRYKIDYILWTGVIRENAEYKKWVEVLNYQQKLGAKILIAESGQQIVLGNVLIDTIFPQENLQGQEMQNTSNDSGVVSKLIYGNNSFLFTGDISSRAEQRLVYLGKDISSDVLKVAHHGSKYSTSNIFLENVKPKVAVIEVGKNSYGHPTPEVLNRLQNFGIKVFTTYKDGDIKFISDGNNIKLTK